MAPMGLDKSRNTERGSQGEGSAVEEAEAEAEAVAGSFFPSLVILMAFSSPVSFVGSRVNCSLSFANVL